MEHIDPPEPAYSSSYFKIQPPAQIRLGYVQVTDPSGRDTIDRMMHYYEEEENEFLKKVYLESLLVKLENNILRVVDRWTLARRFKIFDLVDPDKAIVRATSPDGARIVRALFGRALRIGSHRCLCPEAPGRWYQIALDQRTNV